MKAPPAATSPVLDGLHEYLGDDVQIRYSEGCHLYADKLNGLAQEGELISEVKGVCAESDVVICCLGLDSGLEGEEGDQGNQFASGDKPNLNLPGHQEEILRVCLDSGKPVVVVVLSGSALAVNTAENEAAAVLQAWYPGAMGGWPWPAPCLAKSTRRASCRSRSIIPTPTCPPSPITR